MKLREITVRNFKAFHGMHTIRFPEKANRNVYLIGALNGSGKTSLIQSIQLALYGPAAAGLPAMFRGGRDHRRQYESWLSACLNRQASTDHEDNLSVRLMLEQQGILLTISRTYWFDVDGKLEDSALHLITNDVRGQEGATFEGEDAENELVRLLPRHLADITFFDGERVRDLESGAASGWLTQAVDQLLDLEPVKKAHSDLKRLSRERRVLLATEQEAAARERLEDTLSNIDIEISGLRAELADGNESLVHLRAEVTSLDLEIDTALAGGRPATSAQVETEVASLIKRRNDLRSRLGRHLGEWLYFELAAGLRQATVDEADVERTSRSSRDRAKLEAEAVGRFAERLLSSATRKALGAEATRIVEDRIGRGLDLFPIPDTAAGTSAWLELFSEDELGDVRAAGDTIANRDRTDASHIAEDLISLSTRLEQLGDLRSSLSAHAGLEHFIRRREEAGARVRESESELAQLETAVEACMTRRKNTKQLLGRMDASMSTSEEAQAWLDGAESLMSALDRYVESQRIVAWDALADAVLTRLNQLLRKKALVSSVEVDGQSRGVVLRDAKGRKVELPSAGEQQLAAFAFAAAMLELSEEELPLFIDTPLARLDGPHRLKFANTYLPSLRRQVFVLSTDEEVDDRLLKMLSPYVAEQYLIEHDERVGSSRIATGSYVTGATRD